MWEWGGLGTSVTTDHKLDLTLCSAHLCCNLRMSQNIDSLPVACAHTVLRSWNHQERYLRFASTFVNTLIISAQIAIQSSDLASFPCSVYQNARGGAFWPDYSVPNLGGRRNTEDLACAKRKRSDTFCDFFCTRGRSWSLLSPGWATTKKRSKKTLGTQPSLIPASFPGNPTSFPGNQASFPGNPTSFPSLVFDHLEQGPWTENGDKCLASSCWSVGNH